jgi:hypothetical protein
MPTYVAFGKDFGITLEDEPEDVAEKLASAPPGRLVEFDAAEKGERTRYLVNGGGVCWVVRVGAPDDDKPPPPPPPPRPQ